jgi:O-antigen/teichoic acid export membrane protein
LEALNKVIRGHPGFLYVAIGQAGSLVIGAVFWFLMARLLDPGAYGQVNWLVSIAMFASTCCVLGWGKTIVTYYPREGREGLIGGAVMIVLAASLAVGIAMGVLVDPLVGLLILGLSLFSITLSSELGRRRYGRYMWISLAAKLAVMPLAVLLYLWLGLPGVVLGYAIPTLLFGLPSVRRVRSNPGIEEAKGKTGFALRSFGADITTGSAGFLDKILIGGIFGMVALGLYQLAYQIFTLLSVLPGILFTYLLPEKSAGARTREVESMGILASVALAVLTVLLSPIIIPRVFPSFAESVQLIQIMSLGVIPSAIAMTKMSELYARERPGAVLISYLIALAVGIAGIVTLGSCFGGIGLAASMLLLQTTLATSLVFLED